ncbi:MAG: serine hydrolase [Clostridiales Family XIII bacterium]|jgi:D-alanyl-D-alanine carboxypeptidase (penicillin-binding protein 5/6)|nr:serine hydrolase [Clostridiales Family XIII bacterium]
MAKDYYFSFSRNRWDPTPLIVVVIIVCLAAAAYAWFNAKDAEAVETQEAAVAAALEDLRAEANSVKVSVDLPGRLNSESYILLQRSDYNRKFEMKGGWESATPDATPAEDAFMHERIRMAKEANERVYPASMAKMLTALVLIERIPTEDYDKSIEITRADMDYLYNDGASVAGFEIGEKVSARDLLYGLMLPSGAECASALARYSAGDVEEFVESMNAKAVEIGMTDSHFSNPVGLHDEETYTTVSDIALLLDYAMRDERFSEIISTQKYKTAPTNKHEDGLEMKSTFYQQGEIVLKSDDGEIIGGKTGYTSEAGQCLASYMEKGGERFILVTAAAKPEDFHKKALHIEDMLSVFNALEVNRSAEQ